MQQLPLKAAISLVITESNFAQRNPDSKSDLVCLNCNLKIEKKTVIAFNDRFTYFDFNILMTKLSKICVYPHSRMPNQNLESIKQYKFI